MFECGLFNDKNGYLCKSESWLLARLKKSRSDMIHVRIQEFSSGGWGGCRSIWHIKMLWQRFLCKLLSLLCLGLNMRKCWSIFSPIVHTFHWNRVLNFKGSHNWNGETSRIIGVIKFYYVHVQCIFKHMLCSLKQKQRKEWMSSHKIYQAKCFVESSISNVTKLCPPIAICIGSKRFMWMYQSPSLPYLHISLAVTC